MWVTKLLISPVKKKDFLPKNDQIWPKIDIFGQFGPGHAGLFGALLVGRLVAVVRGLYLARHLFTLFQTRICAYLRSNNQCIKRFHQRTFLCYAGQHIIYFQRLVGLCSLSPEPESDRAEHELANCSHVFVISSFWFLCLTT